MRSTKHSERNQSNTVRRRTFLAGAATTAVALSGCVSGGSDDPDDNTDSDPGKETDATENNGQATDSNDKLDFTGKRLNVLIWSGNYADRFKSTVQPLYEEQTGAVLNVKTGWDDITGTMADPEEKIDVSITEGSTFQTAQNNDLIHPVRQENVPQLDNVLDYYRNFRPTARGVPVDGAPCTIVHRSDLDSEIETWADVFPAAQGTNGIGLDYGFWAFPMHAVAIGMDSETGASEIYNGNIDAVWDAFAELNISGWATSGNDIWTMFDDGQIDIAQWYLEQVHYDIDFQSSELSHTTPKNSPAFLNHWTVVRGSEDRGRRRMGEHFLNFLLSAETQTKWAKSSPGMYTNQNTEYPSELAEIVPTNSEQAKQLVFPDWEPILANWETFKSEIDAIKQASMA
ncbi:extracellular solute-binding protein [Halovenus rubra]|uniref:Extracellular solute-binding protein n=2 Tax=Halovenus rubra TaxID=869890 RepID=A0ACC7E4H8_9EURY|nr:extracellular solute-binding protein [Halovenus rubra]